MVHLCIFLLLLQLFSECAAHYLKVPFRVKNLSNDYPGYYVNLSIGFPYQEVEMILSTEFADTIISSEYNSKEGFVPFYAFGKSLTVFSNLTNAGSNYSFYRSNYKTDEFHFDGVTVKDVSFVYVTKYPKYQVNVLGLNPLLPVASKINNVEIKYQLILNKLYDSKLISRRLFSIFQLSDQGVVNNGTILFGAIDNKKFNESLQTIDFEINEVSNSRKRLGIYQGIYLNLTGLDFLHVIKDDKGNVYEFQINLYTYKNNTMSNQPIKANIDIDFWDYAMSFPKSISKIFFGKYLKLKIGDIYQPYDCRVAFKHDYFRFSFTNKIIKIPFSNFYNFDFYTEDCVLTRDSIGVNSFSDNEVFLGDSFLRSLVMVYDFDSKEVSFSKLLNLTLPYEENIISVNDSMSNYKDILSY
ncbi:acid protease [Ascoidea rubescens DSM 1968]|uniref:Acid protease n=1 Tax=Ascoidea rubescens DSM 1968 TaxID=1344418 RepID=A0A1D2VHB4_9ASCO|nr:acid protease [Ascoidea rubescens DSM 1968]ODV60877.1 acid protease [Ascoidea rubescens DSM 1968]